MPTLAYGDWEQMSSHRVASCAWDVEMYQSCPRHQQAVDRRSARHSLDRIMEGRVLDPIL